MQPFKIAVSQEQIDQLNRKIDATIWPVESWHGADDWSYGTPASYLRPLIEYWRNTFDWRATERQLNGFPQFITPIDGLQTHFIHARSPHREATPLLLVHGWPGSIVEFLEVIPRLIEPEKFGGSPADAYHVVCPSLPGYAFSAAAQEPGMAPDRIAAMHARLMQALGYDRFVAQGGDWGAICCRYLPDVCEDRLLGLHLNLTLPIPPTGLDNAESVLTEQERQCVAEWTVKDWQSSGYSHLQGTKPLTPSYGLSDSPVALAAWITEKFHGWTDNDGDLRSAVDWDKLLANIALYWFTGSIGSSVRLYTEFFVALENGKHRGARCNVPTGIARYPGEHWAQPRSWAEIEYNIVHWFEPAAGGHFAAMEQPAIFSQDLWTFNARIREHRQTKSA